MDIKELTREELAAWLVEHGDKPFRARQALRWVYRRGATSIAAMTDLSATLRAQLAASFEIRRLACDRSVRSPDGTRKYLFALESGRRIESVCIPARGRRTLCVSSQAGCGMGCRFCATANVRPVSDLTAGEIISQVWEVQRTLGPGERLTNIVFMGMGEPLANYAALVKALTVLTAEWGFDFSPRRVTVSTVGLVPELKRLLAETPVNLTVSLSATTDTARTSLMPVNRRYSLAALLDACRALPVTPRRRITFAYTMLEDVNDTPADAKRLTGLLHGLRAKVNLIPFNPYAGTSYRSSPHDRIVAFQRYLLARGIHATVRESRGREVHGACGQLVAAANETEKRSTAI